MDCFSLSRLHTYIRRVISVNFPESIWVRAEIFNVVQKSGHYYIELGEKSNTDEIIAQSSAILWKSQAESISQQLQSSLSSILKAGNEIMFKANVDFHVRYGLKLQVLELNKEFTFGLIALNKQKVIQDLKNEGLWQLNKSLQLPKTIQRIALITSETSAAFADFTDQLLQNRFAYKFKLHSFNVAVQGQLSSKNFVKTFQAIEKNSSSYDIVVIIRGGGSKHDLSDFDQYEISKAVSICSLPVITGIGHQTDVSITDHSAFLSLKTPTAVAEFIIQHTTDAEALAIHCMNEINQWAQWQCNRLNQNLQGLSSNIKLQSSQRISNEHRKIYKTQQNYLNAATGVLLSLKEKQHFLQLLFSMNDPVSILGKGYSISTIDGKALHKLNNLAPGQELTTVYQSGILKSKITDVWENEK
ncbi:MAG: exodeoxyribonuclease VII large subunit [Saprospiraceae bacterium]|nr:exodeoxyribonuclease VII large subunit [Saprospiraceae bacterium]